MPRELASWLDGFIEYTERLESPKIFRKWTALFTVAAALERKVWVTTGKGDLYPNIYVIIVGPPGAGKTLATGVARKILLTLEDHFIAPTSVTRASLMDEVRNAERKIIRPQEKPDVITFNSLTITCDELGVLLPAYENDFMNVLTAIYDGYLYSESRRTKDLHFTIENPLLNMIAATTPSYLNNFLPDGAWDQGFLSRTMLIYSGASAPGDLFAKTNYNQKLYDALIRDLDRIANIYGPIQFEPDAAEAITAWHKAGGTPVPDHPKLVHYNTRRTAHLLKLCQIICAATSDDRRITIDHYVEALDTLTQVEHYIPDIFRSMARGGDSQVIADTWHYLFHAHMKENRPIPENRIITFLQERTPSHNIMRIIDVMVRGGILGEELVAGVGKAYTVKPMKPNV